MKTLSEKVLDTVGYIMQRELIEIEENKTTIFFEDANGSKYKVSRKTGVVNILNLITGKWYKITTLEV